MKITFFSLRLHQSSFINYVLFFTERTPIVEYLYVLSELKNETDLLI